MKKCLSSLLLLLLAAGCVVTPRRETAPLMPPLRLAEEKVRNARTASFRQLTSGLKLRGTGCYLSAVTTGSIPVPEVLDAIEALGFNRIYGSITSETELDEPLKLFLAAAAERKLPVEIVVYQRDFFVRSRGNRLIRSIIPKHPDLKRIIELIVEYNDQLPPAHRIAGITVVVEPHRFDIARTLAPHEQIYAWRDEAYGIGMDNDMLMRKAFAELPALAPAAGGIPVTLSVQDFYHDRAAAGQLSKGLISDFRQAVPSMPRLLITNSGNRPTQLVKAVVDELAAANDGMKMAVVINLARHTSVEAGALRRRDWNDMERALRYMLKNTSGYPAFEGIVIGPLSALEFLRMEKD